MAQRAARFAHRSEEGFAHLLDFYRIEWQYEPRSFPVCWDKRGQATEFFTPDFYLPEFDLYLEVTVLNPRLQSRKNRKIRLLRAAHPQIKVKLFSRRDVQRLFAQKGLGAVAAT